MKKNIIITGASRGIGLETALQFANNGDHVLAISRTTSALLLSHPNISCLTVDLTQEAELEQVSFFLNQNWKQVDAVLHNAGRLIFKPFAATTIDDFENVYQVNVFAVVRLTQICLPFLFSGSHVVSISSMGGVQGSAKFAGLSAYSSSKGALITLTELCAEEFKEAGISFNVLALGAVQTEMLETAFPGYTAPISAHKMAQYIVDFVRNGQQFFNGKVLQVAMSTP